MQMSLIKFATSCMTLMGVRLFDNTPQIFFKFDHPEEEDRPVLEYGT